MTGNVQNLPAGLAGRAAAAAQPAPAAAPAPAVTPFDQGPVTQPQAAPAPVVASEPVAAPVNPMLSHVSQPNAEPAAAAPAAALPVIAALEPVPVPAEKPAEAVQSSSVTAMVGELSKDPNLSAAVSYLDGICADKKIDTTRAFGNAAEEGDARFIDRAYLKEVLGDGADAVIKTAEGILAYTTQYADQTIQSVMTMAGGQAQWDSAMAAFNEKGSPADKRLMKELFDSGVRTKVEHAAKQVLQFATQAGIRVQHNAPALGQPGTQQGLSKADYIKAISARNLPEAEYQKLRSQRQLGMQQGL